MKKLFFAILILFIAVFQGLTQTSETYSWKNVAIGGGGFVSGVFFSPIEQNVIYARTDVGGAYRWNESAKSWISMMDWVNADERGLLGIEALAIDPAQPGTVYMMAGTVYWNQADDGIGRSAFLRSQDYGQTWEKIPVWDNSIKYFNVHGNGMGRGNGERLAIDPANSNTMFYGTRNKGLWKSPDNGSSWTKVSSFPVDTTWNGCGISFVAFDPSTKGSSQTTRIYVGVLRKSDNVFVSDDAGATWSLVPNRPTPQYATDLMPQRIAIRPDGSAIYITFGNGAGPHTMQWDEGWGAINDWFNRGAVFKYELSSQSWTDISPQDLIDPENDGDPSDPSTYYGCYSGISIDPNNPDHMVASSISSYRGPQFWLIDGSWVDKWGDNIFVTEDGGETWVPSFQYYWLDGGIEPNAEQMDENGVPWIIGNTIHWIGSTAIDPYNPQRVFVTSGNGVFMTEDIFNYEWSYVNEWGAADTTYTQYTVWKFAGQGIEEVVPEDLVSILGGPLVSVIGDYDGFVHTDVTQSPATGRLTTVVDGTEFTLGSTTGLAFAPQSGKLAKVAKTRSVSTQYNTIPIGPVQYSTDNGITWTTETYTSNPPTDLIGGKVALSADGNATLWMPSEGTTMYRHFNSTWSTVSGISFNGRPFADQVNADKFYVYNNSTGYMYVSTDKGVSFVQAGLAGTSSFRAARSVTDNEGHVWVPIAINDGSLSGGLMRSTDGGVTFSAVSGVGYCEAVGFGKAASGASYPTVFVFAEIDGILGVWRSVDEGVNWVRVNDDEHEYGGLANGEFVMGDMNVYGRVYMSTAGRGIVYGDPSGNTVPVTGVTISPSIASVSVGGTVQLTATIAPSNATNKSVAWNSGNSNIATVSSTGLVTGVAPGTVSVSATTYDGGFIATAQVTVSEVSVTGITVTPTSVSLDPNETAQIEATITPSDATDKSITWTSADESVAQVDGAGLITAISDGNTTITATTTDGGYTASVSVTVNFVEIPVTGVSVSPASVLVQPGNTTTLTPELVPFNATNQSVSWSSNNESVATVSSEGLVTGITVGTATITVTTNDGGFTASSVVTVSDIETGTILCEYWTNIAGTSISDLTSNTNYPNSPSSIVYLESLEISVNQGDNYGTRIRGYIYPPESGSYTFWLAGDDYCDLYLSTNSEPANTSRISYVEGYTDSQEWTKYSSQESVAIDLVAGQQYYIEVLHKEGSGGDNLAVAWEGPGITQQVIDGAYLSPFETGQSTNNPPVAVVSASPVSGFAPLTVSFDASASTDADGDTLAYSWAFGDGNTATGATVQNIYSTTGNYSAVVTVSDGNGGSDEASVSIVVSEEGVVQYTLTTSVTGSGSIQLSPAGGLYDEGTQVSATAVASSGYHFVTWSGDASGTSAAITLTMDADKSIIAAFEADTTGEPCENPVSISIPFTQTGVGEFCFVTTTEMAYVNSWNMEIVEINGVDFTNTWSDNLPAAIDGQWFIYYKGNYDWSHFEAPGAKSTTPEGFADLGTSVELYPNPFTSFIHIAIENPGVIRKIEVLDNLGRIVAFLDKSQITQQIEFGNGLAKGVYFIKVSTSSDSQTFIVYKN